jgi:hypothetical protein
MKITLTDKLHIAIGLNIFLIVWDAVEWLEISTNGIWFGMLSALIVSTLKELNDKYSWVKWLLTDGKTKTGLSGRDIMFGTVPSFIWIFIYYVIYGNTI